jgi:hypothetical protein
VPPPRGASRHGRRSRPRDHLDRSSVTLASRRTKSRPKPWPDALVCATPTIPRRAAAVPPPPRPLRASLAARSVINVQIAPQPRSKGPGTGQPRVAAATLQKGPCVFRNHNHNLPPVEILAFRSFSFRIGPELLLFLQPIDL